MVTITVDTDGTSGDYSSLAAAVAALPDPFTDDYTIKCYATTSTDDTTAVSINIDTTADYRLYIVAGDANYRLYFAGGTYLSIVYTFGNVANVTLDGLTIEQSSASANYQYLVTLGPVRNSRVIITGCTIASVSTSTYRGRIIVLEVNSSNSSDCVLVNNIIINRSTVEHLASSHVYSNYDYTTFFYNNTFIGGYNALYNTATLTNWLFINNIFYDQSNAIGGTLSDDSDYNSTDLSSGLSGDNDRTSQSFSFTSDYRLQSDDTGARDHGISLASDSNYSFSTDIDGNSRGATWDIGASEYVSSGGSSLAVYRHHYEQQGMM